MATFRATINLSSPDVLSSEIRLSASISTEVDSGYLMKSKVGNTDGLFTSTPPPLTLYKRDDKSESAYLFIRNMGDEREKYIYVSEKTNGAVVAKIPGADFALIPLVTTSTYSVHGTEVDQMIEYGVFGNDSSAVSFA